MNDIELLDVSGHSLWRAYGELQPASYIRYLLKSRGMSAIRANSTMRTYKPKKLRKLAVPLVALTRGTRTLGYRCETWIGPRCASVRATRAFFRRDGYSPAEVCSLFALARRQRVALAHVADAIAHGIAI